MNKASTTAQAKDSRSASAAKGHAARRARRLAADIRRAEAVGFHARGSHDWVRVDEMFTDLRYQRDVDRQRVERMAAAFDPDKLGVVYVSDRGNGRYAIIDGSHRVAVMQHIGWGDQKMAAFVFSGLSVQEEAELFTSMNKDRRNPHPVDLFRAEVAAGRADAVGMQDVFNAAGVRVSKAPGAGQLRAVAAARRVYTTSGERGGEVLGRALQIMGSAWERYDDTFNGDVLSGLALLIFVEGDRLEDAQMTSRLADFSPTMILNKARAAREVLTSMTPAGAVAFVLVKLYNAKRRPQRRLAEFAYQGWPKVTSTGVLYGHGWSEDTSTQPELLTVVA